MDDDESNQIVYKEHEQGMKDDEFESDGETSVIDRTDGQWRVRKANGEYGYGFWFRFLGPTDPFSFLATIS
jgi:hypothetical protein